MNEIIIKDVITKMRDTLDEAQLIKLKAALIEAFQKKETSDNTDYIQKFLAAKKIEGCSKRTDEYYEQVLNCFKKNINKFITKIETEDVRIYLANYQRINNCSNVTLDNIRRILSSFYKWLENEDYIIKSPLNRIHKVKAPVTVKTVFTDEEIELIRNDLSNNKRNLAIVNLLISSGIRISELVNLDIDDINLSNRTGIVKGKGNKERIIYFDVKTKISLEKYLQARSDKNIALFVSEKKYGLGKENNRVTINNTESIIRESGKRLNISKAHPHKFRRTIATKAIDKGMPIEQVQKLLGHTKIDTTLHYAQVQQKNVMISYQKYIN